MQPVDTNWPGFQPLGVALSVPRALPWAGIGARRWRLRPSAGYGFLGGVTTSAFSQTEPLPKAPFILQNWPGFQPLGCGSICTQGFALGWHRSAPLALEAIRRVSIFGDRHNFSFFSN